MKNRLALLRGLNTEPILLAIILALFTVGCGQNGEIQKDGKLKTSASATTTAPHSPTPTDTAIPDTQGSTKEIVPKSLLVTVIDTMVTDILLVIDNSGSMRYEQANMAERFNNLLREIKGLDWRLAIITTDVVEGDKPTQDGRLLEFVGMPGRFYLSSEMPEDQVLEAFARTIQRPPREGSANEQGLRAIWRSLERDSSWMREFGSFNAVVVSDADESPPKGWQPNKMNDPESLLGFVKTTFPKKPFYFHSIIVKNGDVKCLKDPKSDNEDYGRLYEWLSNKTGGYIGDVCASDYANQLKMMGQHVSQKVKTVELECEPLPGSVKGRNDQNLPFPDFEVVGKTINFQEPLPSGHNIINYKCEQ